MTQVNRDDLVQIVGPLIHALPPLWRALERLDGTDAVHHATISTLEAELAEERKQKFRAEQERDEAIRQCDEFRAEVQELHEQVIRQQSRIDERGLPRVCCRCPSNTVVVTCRKCGEILLEDKPYQD